MGKKPMTSLLKKEAIKLYKDGAPIKEISRLIGFGDTSIWKVVKDSDTEVRKANAPRKFKEADIKKLIELYSDEKNTIKGIMQQLGIKSEHTIYRLLRANNIKLRGRNKLNKS